MNSENTLKNVFLPVAACLEEELSAELDHYALPRHHFSHRYQRRKRQILTELGEKKAAHGLPRRLVWVMVSILALFGCAMSVPDIRKPIVSFLERVFQKATYYEIDTGDKELHESGRMQKDFTMNYIPEGFELKDTVADAGIYMEVYENNAGTSFSITVMPYYQKNNFSFDTEDADVVRTEIQDNYTVVSQKGSSINIIEFDDTNNKIYNLVGEIDSDTAIQIIKKISNQ